MTDLFERQLAERLQAHPLPEEIPALGIRSVRLGERIRRRRIGAAALAVVLLLIIPAAAGLWRLAFDTENPPVISPSSPAPKASTGPKTVVLDLGIRTLGTAPEVSTVRGGTSVWLPSGKTVKLPNGQFGSIAEYGSGLAWLTRTGGEVQLNVSAERLPRQHERTRGDRSGARSQWIGHGTDESRSGVSHKRRQAHHILPTRVAHQPNGCHGRRHLGREGRAGVARSDG